MDPTNRNTALCSVLADELARAGVEHAVVCPGSRSAPLALAMWSEPAIKVWSVIDERCAGFFAIGIALATGRPAAIVTTSGTAAANLHPAVAEAAEARVPLIALTADRPPELRARGAGQTIDQVKLYGDSVCWFCELGNIDADDDGLLHFRSSAARAVAAATGVTPGPVHLNIPLREPLATRADPGAVTAERAIAIEGRSERRGITNLTPRAEQPIEPVVGAIGDAIRRVPHGLIVAGRQTDGELPAALQRLALATGYPLLAEPTSQARRAGELHAIAAYDSIFRALPDALAPQMVLRFGDMPTSKPLRQWLSRHDECSQIVIDPTEAWSEPTHVAGAIVRNDPVALCDALAARQFDPDEQWAERWHAAEAAAQQAIDAALPDALTEPGLFRALADSLADGSVVFVASSMPIRDLEAYLPALDVDVTFLSNRGANGIDGTISSALGASAASGLHTVAILGDVALYHDMNGLLAMSRNEVPATIVAIDNGGGRIFDFLPVADPQPDGYAELFTTRTGLSIERMAALYGIPHIRIEALDQLNSALTMPGIVEVPTDGDANVALHREISAAVEAAVTSALAG